MNEVSKLTEATTLTGEQPWWRGASIYQIYPRSFMDSNDDGIGDLPGITEKLGYVADLGVDAIWVSPFYTSPMLDFGYDVAAFRDVDPIFGTLSDFDALVKRAHELDLKVIIDQVYSHCSDQHRWFAESRSSRDNPKADWFVWADPKPDGTPPNNWQSIFSGPAWSWDARRQQFYFHNFLPQQPDLNLHNPAVQEELLDVGRFWLDRGVDGIRVDAVLHFMHDPALTDNPVSSDPNKIKARGHDFQDNIHNQGHPAIFDFLEKLRGMTDEYGAIFSVAEVGGSGVRDFTRACAEGDKRLNSAYGFDFLYASRLTPELVCSAQKDWPDTPGTGWPTWAFENHDAPRAISRWHTGPDREAFLRFKMAVFCALRGNIILYQGEELGLDQVEIPYELVQDPEALRNWPLTLSRDGARTPMPWLAEAPQAGFSKAEPWLPIGAENATKSVELQQGDAGSLLSHTRAMLALRKAHPAIQHGAVTRCEVRGDLLLFERTSNDEKVRYVFNFGSEAQDCPPGEAEGELIAAVNDASSERLPAFSALVLKL
ncbi:alpha-amylase family glycosyl hydrolase [Altererythrobacter arenosus]|uniref:Alpha-amylase family glycosyl hydrolase n=1 Tax=Altererythrobacter arenosus TaxID=3032592 RepID=A0ABY8FN04_9SPHN|nr:alpha-amylase family glycosyl hydrolase [Altererythrobacter sp. CAU 1644]WFL76404.1 alpha-amylase family glycosyl hydrolase [Altererythrobacter sp. CAU 1644]